MPPDGGAARRAGDDEIMPLGLARDRGADRRVEREIVLRLPERRAQVGGILLAEAHVERAGAGDAHAVAILAEIMGQGRDETEPAAGFPDVEIARRAAALVMRRDEGKALRKIGAKLRQRQILID